MNSWFLTYFYLLKHNIHPECTHDFTYAHTHTHTHTHTHFPEEATLQQQACFLQSNTCYKKPGIFRERGDSQMFKQERYKVSLWHAVLNGTEAPMGSCQKHTAPGRGGWLSPGKSEKMSTSRRSMTTMGSKKLNLKKINPWVHSDTKEVWWEEGKQEGRKVLFIEEYQ